MPPLVTVLIPAYNAAQTITRALDSAFAQDYSNFEVVVVDDGSSDATSEIVANYGRAEIRLLSLPQNRGEGGVLNAGIEIAKGEYIAFLDADDEWLPGKVSRQIELLEANPKATMATCGCRFVDAMGVTTELFGMPPPNTSKGEIWRCLLAAAGIAKPCVIARKSALERVGDFDTSVPVAADQDMWIRLAMAGEVEFLSEYLTIAHDTPGSLTKIHIDKMHKSVLPMVRRHIDKRRGELSPQKIRQILRERYTIVGRNLYLHGTLFRGAALLLGAAALGGRPAENLWYLATASPPARLAKRLIAREVRETAQGAPLRGSSDGSLLTPEPQALAEIPPGPPILIVTIDTEAEFDWNGPFLRTHTGVRNIRQVGLAQRIFDRFGVRPVYLVDYAVAINREASQQLRDLADAGKCEIGAHLQPWENPPFVERLDDRTSFNSNLPGWLQKEKLARLTEAIETNLNVKPISYRSGRYGVGEETAWILRSLGYRIDLSVLPGVDLRDRHGPDFRQASNRPYWFGPGRALLEIPITAGFLGLSASLDPAQRMVPSLYNLTGRPRGARLHLPGILSRAHLLERVTLSPEGISAQELKKLTRVLRARGHRVFAMTFHSSSLLAGSTPYVRTEKDLDHFLGTIDAYLSFFFGELGGMTMIPAEFRRDLLGDGATVDATRPGSVGPAR
jgi:GT2 family glycosyltransferase